MYTVEKNDLHDAMVRGIAKGVAAGLSPEEAQNIVLRKAHYLSTFFPETVDDLSGEDRQYADRVKEEALGKLATEDLVDLQG